MSLITRHLYGCDPASVSRVVRILNNGGIGAIPTETVYGLAGDATNPEAVSRIFKAKERPWTDPLIVHVAGLEKAEELGLFSAQARNLAQYFWPGPLTLVVPKKAIIPDSVTAGKPTVALRSPMHPLTNSLLATGNLALAAPSANPFGGISPTRPEHVLHGLSGRIDFLLDGGPTGWGLESTVLDVSASREWKLYRPGPISAEAIQTWLEMHAPGVDLTDFTTHSRARNEEQSANEGKGLPAPGLLSRHYSPATPLIIVEPDALDKGLEQWDKTANTALVLSGLEGHRDETGNPDIYHCSRDGSLDSAAAEFYSLLHRLDSKGYHTIYFEKFPEVGMGTVINNRLLRAASATIA